MRIADLRYAKTHDPRCIEQIDIVLAEDGETVFFYGHTASDETFVATARLQGRPFREEDWRNMGPCWRRLE